MIIILDDHPLARQGLSSLIQMYKPEEKVLHAGTVREAIKLIEDNDVDMVFVDLNLGKENGFDFLTWLKDEEKKPKTIVITSSSRQSDFVYAQKLEVDAYVLKDAFIDEIMYGLKIVERGGKFYSATLMERLNKISEDEKALSELTEREMDVLALLSQGCSNAKISKTLFISEGTTKKHISSILSKLNLQHRVEAVLLARNNSYSVRIAISKSLRANLRKSDAYAK